MRNNWTIIAAAVLAIVTATLAIILRPVRQTGYRETSQIETSNSQTAASNTQVIAVLMLAVTAMITASLAIVFRPVRKTGEWETLTANVTETETTETTTEATETEPVSKETTTEVKLPKTTQNHTEAVTVASTAKYSSKVVSKLHYDDGEEVYITAAEYEEICGVVMNETGYGSYEGCVAVAQCIRNQIIRERALGHAYDVPSVRRTYQEHYTKTPNEQVRQAVIDVFYNHTVVTTEPIIAWCAGYSEWHATQICVCSYDGNKFYKLR